MPAVLTDQQWKNLIKTYAEVKSYPGVYVLGCFAKCVTLYSQQVRAFNLVYGLYRTKALKPGSKVAVIGAGAAGLAAAAALAQLDLKCEVTLLESTKGVLRLQYNCHHRWIHPHIYDWPDMQDQGDQSLLPIFNWKAGYAADVTRQIEKIWLQNSKNITTRFSVRDIDLSKNESGQGYTLSWIDHPREPASKEIDHLIIATGFGLEPKNASSESYWSGDTVDDDFHEESASERWLISGFGDGALSDLMRSCIDSFSHADIISLFETYGGRAGLENDVRDLHSDPSLSEEEISRRFHQLSTGDLQDKLRGRLREWGPEIFLTGRTSEVYGPGSSILNRLIVLLLSRLGAFAYLPGPSSLAEKIDDKYHVRLGYPAAVKVFDRFIVRHGTNAATKKFAKKIMSEDACDDLVSAWKIITPKSDLSRIKLWPPGFFGAEGLPEDPMPVLKGRASSGPLAAREQAFEESVKRFGAKVSHLAFYKELQEGGISTVTYVVQGLVSTDKPIKGVHFFYESVAGKIDTPALDSAEQERYGLTWEPDQRNTNIPSTMDELRRKVRKIAGKVLFKKPLEPSDPPMTFTLTLTILNGDALTHWEFDQLYDQSERIHVDTKHLRHPMEYFARVVWCPVETLKMQVRLPNARLGKPAVSVFTLPTGTEIEPNEVVRDSILRLYPPAGSHGEISGGEWERQKEVPARDGGLHPTNPSFQTWELTVDRPAVGSCYSLDWSLPEWKADAETKQIAQDAADLRSRLLNYGKSRWLGTAFAKKREIRAHFLRLHREIADLQGRGSFKEPFDVALMTYDDTERRLRYIDGTCNGKEPKPELGDFWLPFGLGLSGVCLKRGDRPYLYFADEVNDLTPKTDYYLKIPGTSAHRGMVAFPLVHPNWYGPAPSEIVENGRMCIGVVDISFLDEPKWLQSFRVSNDTELVELRSICQNFCDKLCVALRSA
ncbi:FAD-dependent oxidoreductase [Tunturiibacter psychrotolerans]|uniref:FAD-dependent oxidoreductase n=1 Tax=Tunturiibacter psychrotolerans TaxID=3069686 RepID=UPI003D22A3F8